MSIRKASEHFGIKRSTLGDHVSGKVSSRKSGRSTVFSAEVENHIVKKAQTASSQGFGISRKQLFRKAGRLAQTMKIKTPFKNGIPGQAWWGGFRRRNPELVLRKPEKLTGTRARNLNQVQVNNYFKDLEEHINQLSLNDKPTFIWNVDETNLSMEHTKAVQKRSKVRPGLSL